MAEVPATAQASDYERDSIRFRVIAESALDIITLLDANGVIQYESPSFERWLGYSAAEMIGQNAFEFIHPDDIQRVFEVFAIGIEQPDYEGITEYRFRHVDGSYRILESRAINRLHDPNVAGVIVSSRDVTERRRAEEALRESEARTRALLDAIPDAMVRISREGRYLDFRAASAYPSVIPPAAYYGRKLEEMLPPDLAAMARKSVVQALETGQIQTFEYDIQVNGERRYREARVVVSGPDEAVAITRDVTEKKRTEQNFRELFRASPDPIVVMRPEGLVLDTNPAAARLHDLPLEELVGSLWFDGIPSRLHASVREGLQALLDGQQAAIEAWVLTGAGAEVPVEIRASRVTYSDTGAVLLHIRDITERKRAEEALRLSRERLRAVVNNVPIVLFAVDWERRFVLAEGRALESLGASPNEVVGKKVPELYVNHRAFVEAVERALHGEEVAETMALRERIFECRIVPYLRPDGSVGTVTGVAADVTELVQRGEELEASREQLRHLTARLQSVREEERLNLSREVHDVLGGALTALKMDTRWLSTHRTDEADTYERRIASMVELIDDTIGTVRRISSELRPAVLDKFGLAAALEWWGQEFEQRTGIRCRFIEEPMDVEVDDERGIALFRIFQETLTNVARHARASEVTVLFEERLDELFLQVRDDGRGLENAEVVNTTSLGVLGMRERARAFGGDVCLEGAPGRGTTVTARIPAAAASR